MRPEVKLVCFNGPESTGKSVMAERFAKIYHTLVVPEVAKEIITSNDFSVEDIIRIGQAQTERILEKSKAANRILFCDTDLITTQIYSRHYLKTVPEILFSLEGQIRFDKYFLFYPDVPWVADGLRDLGDQRDEMMKIFEEGLIQRKIAFIPVKGGWKEREAIVEKEINKLLSN